MFWGLNSRHQRLYLLNHLTTSCHWPPTHLWTYCLMMALGHKESRLSSLHKKQMTPGSVGGRRTQQMEEGWVVPECWRAECQDLERAAGPCPRNTPRDPLIITSSGCWEKLEAELSALRGGAAALGSVCLAQMQRCNSIRPMPPAHRSWRCTRKCGVISTQSSELLVLLGLFCRSTISI